MMAFAAANAARGLAQFFSWPVIGSDNMRQLMKTCLFAFTDVEPVIYADLHPASASISTAASRATHNGYRVGVCRECILEPTHLLNDMNVSCTLPVIYYLAIPHEY
jgi:hypothetical protein